MKKSGIELECGRWSLTRKRKVYTQLELATLEEEIDAKNESFLNMKRGVSVINEKLEVYVKEWEKNYQVTLINTEMVRLENCLLNNNLRALQNLNFSFKFEKPVHKVTETAKIKREVVREKPFSKKLNTLTSSIKKAIKPTKNSPKNKSTLDGKNKQSSIFKQ